VARDGAVREERSRIARDLHDDIAQRLALLQIEIDQLKSVDSIGPQEMVSRLDRLSKDTRDIIAAVRSVVYNLHPPDVGDPRLDRMLADRCATLSQQMNLAVDFVGRTTPAVPIETAECLLRVLQESVGNAARHGGVRRVEVRLSSTRKTIRLAVRDFGAGFRPDAPHHGIGLSTMRERVAALGGTIWIQSKPRMRRGTLVALRMPIARPTGQSLGASVARDVAAARRRVPQRH